MQIGLPAIALVLKHGSRPRRGRAIAPNGYPYRLEHGRIGVIVYSPMGSGLLTGGMTRERIQRMADDDWRAHDPRFQEPQLSRT